MFLSSLQKEVAALASIPKDAARDREDPNEGFSVHIRKQPESDPKRVRVDPYSEVLEEPGFSEDPLLLGLEGLFRHDTAPLLHWKTEDYGLQKQQLETITENPSDSDSFVHSFSEQEILEAYHHTSQVQQNSSYGYEAQAGLAIQQIKEEMAGKTKGKGKRPTSRKSRKGSVGSKKGISAPQKDLVGYMNPFPDLDARIPDGQVVTSLPRRCVNVNEWSISEGRIGHCVIFPGLDSGAMFWDTAPDDVTDIQNLFYMRYSGSEGYPDGGWSTSASGAGLTQFGEGTIKFVGDVNKWRLVSQGVRMALTNPDDSNSGWFETCHLHYKFEVDDWELFSPAGNHTGSYVAAAGSISLSYTDNKGYIRPRPEVASEVTPPTISIAETDGYRCGTLRSIAATAFTLPNFQGNHEFRTFDENYFLRAKAAFAVIDNSVDIPVLGGIDVPVSFDEGESDAKDLVRTAIDTTHDLVYIRVYPGQNLVANQVTKLLVQHVSNQEVVYDINSQLHKHMLPTPKADSKKMDQMKTEKTGQAKAFK